jgi:ribose transport system permease protein
MFTAFSVLLPGFLNTGNMLGLLQNVAILGILGLGMAIIVIGRGIDISMVAVLAVPAGLILQMVQDGQSVTVAFGAALALAL